MRAISANGLIVARSFASLVFYGRLRIIVTHVTALCRPVEDEISGHLKSRPLLPVNHLLLGSLD